MSTTCTPFPAPLGWKLDVVDGTWDAIFEDDHASRGVHRPVATIADTLSGRATAVKVGAYQIGHPDGSSHVEQHHVRISDIELTPSAARTVAYAILQAANEAEAAAETASRASA